MKTVITMLLFFTMVTECNHKNSKSLPPKNIKNISLIINMYPAPFYKKYIIDNEEIKITLSSKISKKDSLISKISLTKFDYNLYSSKIDCLKLNSYQNKCINDGEVYDLTLQNNDTIKTIRFSNIYHDSLNEIINLINSNVNIDDKLVYDKSYLQNLPNDCE